MPELTVEDFLQESLSLGSFLTLYVYVLQRLNLEQTVMNEKKTLALLNNWLNQVFPRYLCPHLLLNLLSIFGDLRLNLNSNCPAIE